MRSCCAGAGAAANVPFAAASNVMTAPSLRFWLPTHVAYCGEAILANQSVAIHNLTHPDDPQTELTVDAVELLTVPADLSEYRSAIAAALQHGTRRTIETAPVPKDPASGA